MPWQPLEPQQMSSAVSVKIYSIACRSSSHTIAGQRTRTYIGHRPSASGYRQAASVYRLAAKSQLTLDIRFGLLTPTGIVLRCSTNVELTNIGLEFTSNSEVNPSLP